MDIRSLIGVASMTLESLAVRMDLSKGILLLSSLVVASLYVLLLSNAGSPLFPYMHVDNSIWAVIGRGITEGRVPYLDLYDHKGPLLFFMYGLGFFISDGKLGLYIVEVLVATCILASSFCIARLFLNPRNSLFAMFAVLLWYWGTMQGGAGCEEFSLPFVMIPMYLILKYFMRGGDARIFPCWLSFLIGFCGGTLVMIRMNNAAILCAMAIVLLLFRFRQVSLVAMLVSLGQMTLGLMLAILPFYAYFLYHGAVDYFILGCFIHNFIYAAHGSASWAASDWLHYCWRILPAPVLLLLVWREWRLDQIPRMLLFLIWSGTLLVCFLHIGGRSYYHYYQTFTPVFLLAVCMLIRYWDEVSAKRFLPVYYKKAVRLISIFLLITPYIWPGYVSGVRFVASFAGYIRATGVDRYRQSACELARYIPKEDRDRVWGVDIPSEIFLYMNITPCHRYFVFPTFFRKLVPQIDREIDLFLRNEPPTYIIATDDCSLKEFLHEYYDVVAVSSDKPVFDYNLYKIKVSTQPKPL